MEKITIELCDSLYIELLLLKMGDPNADDNTIKNTIVELIRTFVNNNKQ